MNYAEVIKSLKEQGNFRTIPSGKSCGMVDLSSNDYLGLASTPGLQAEFFDSAANRRFPMTSSAARLLAGEQEQYRLLEITLEGYYGKRALLFNSGYHANAGLPAALGTGKSLIVADKLVHASMIDGIKLSGLPFERFRHNDIAHLRRLLDKHAGEYERVLVLFETVYSMDGDRADVDAMCEVKREYPNVLLYADEAHAVGVEGERGLGLTAGRQEIDVMVGTFGKALASQGAFAIMSDELRDIAINRARSFIFSTAIPPMAAAYTRFLFDKMTLMDERREHLKRLGAILSQALGGEPSHIQPLVVGDAQLAVDLSKKLADEGFKVLPIRTPTVPPGTERLRFSLSAALGVDDIRRLASIIQKVWSKD